MTLGEEEAPVEGRPLRVCSGHRMKNCFIQRETLNWQVRLPH